MGMEGQAVPWRSEPPQHPLRREGLWGVAFGRWGTGGGQGLPKDGFCTQWETVEGYAPTPTIYPGFPEIPQTASRHLISKFTLHRDNQRGQKTKPWNPPDHHLPTWPELQFLLNSLCNFFL